MTSTLHAAVAALLDVLERAADRVVRDVREAADRMGRRAAVRQVRRGVRLRRAAPRRRGRRGARGQRHEREREQQTTSQERPCHRIPPRRPFRRFLLRRPDRVSTQAQDPDSDSMRSIVRSTSSNVVRGLIVHRRSATRPGDLGGARRGEAVAHHRLGDRGLVRVVAVAAEADDRELRGADDLPARRGRAARASACSASAIPCAIASRNAARPNTRSESHSFSAREVRESWTERSRKFTSPPAVSRRTAA